jgi:hypothetical protein
LGGGEGRFQELVRSTTLDSRMDYRIYKSELIIQNQVEMIEHINASHLVHQLGFQSQSSTWTYSDYNFFSLSAPSPLFHTLFLELRDLINEYVPERMKWVQCWLNYHSPKQVLDWHDHEWDYHGYISIDPKNTRTQFREYDIKNEVGNIYIGPGNREHRVIVDDDYDSPRITLGYDVLVHKDGRGSLPDGMLSFIPI